MTLRHQLKLLGFVFAILAVVVTVGLSLPVYAEGEPPEPPPEEVVEETTDETQQQSTENTEQDNPGDEGQDGIDGEPQDEVPPAEDGQDGEPNEDGEPGEDGPEGENMDEPLPDGQTSETNTGNATSTTQANTGANITDIDTQAASTTASSTSPNGGPTDITLNDTLNATTTSTSNAGTGENVALDGDGALQNTGNGVAAALDNFFFNLALVDTNGKIEILLNPSEDQLNFTQSILDMFSGFLLPSDTCTLPGCKTADSMTTYEGSATAGVDRTVISVCNSGDNYGKSQEGFVFQETGDCDAVTVAVTGGNWFAFNSNIMVLLVNNTGDLKANIVLPEPSFFEQLRGGGFAPDSSLALTNTVDLTSSGTSTSGTGDNAALGEQFSGVITGEANSTSGGYNGLNQLNPPTCFIISVGGEWRGDVYQMPNGYDRERMPWGDVICGRGGGEDGKRAIHATSTNYARVVVDAIADAQTGGNTGVGAEVGIKSGDANSFLFVLNLINLTFINEDWLFGLFTVAGDWDGDLVFGVRPGASPGEQAAGAIVSGGSSGKKSSKAAPSLANLTKVSSVSTIISGSTVEYTITLKNKGQKLYNVKLEDVLMNPQGGTLNTQNWDLGEVFPHEEVVVKYTMQFTGQLAPGSYTNAVRLTGNKESAEGPAISPIYASATVTLGGVLGLQSCPAYLSHYISPAGLNNQEQVRLLEIFLRDGRGEAVVPDGIYDPISVEAIKRFQREYASDILSPWGISFATGHVYYTTQKKINELYCRGEATFALNGSQLSEITRYRQFVMGQGPLAPAVVGIPQEPDTLSEAFETAPKVVERQPLLLSLRQNPAGPSLFETLFNWMRFLTSIPVAEAAK